MVKPIFKLLLICLSIAAIVQCFLISFSNMDMTQMRLLVTYWKEYLFFCVIWSATYLAWRND